MTKAHLTDTKVSGLKPRQGERIEIGDDVVIGLRIRATANAKTWIMRVRAGGKVRTITLGPYGRGDDELGLAQARMKAIQTKEEIDGGAIPMPARGRPAPSNRFADQIDVFMQRYAKERVKRPEYYRWQFDKYIAPHFGDWDIAAIKRRDLTDFLDKIADAHGVTTSRRVGGLLKRLFHFCASRDVIENDPAAALMLPGAEVRRSRTLTESEIVALWKATDPASDPGEKDKRGRIKAHPSTYPWGAFARLLLLTGQRRGEVANMKWSAIDLDGRTWAIEETKSDRAQLVPLSDPALDVLRGIPRMEYLDADGEKRLSDWVLTTGGHAPISDFSKPKIRLDAEIGKRLKVQKVTPWRWHDIRRTVSTNLARLEVEPFIRRRVLNHALEGNGIDADGKGRSAGRKHS